LTTPQQLGKAWEEKVAKDTGGVVVKGSGNQPFAKLDVNGNAFLISAKATSFKTYPLGQAEMQEVIDAMFSPAARCAPDTTPIVALRVAGGEFGVFRWSDMLALLADPKPMFRAQKNEAKRRRARTPQLLRDLEENDEQHD
jgi:hypothetical protein